MFDFDPIYLIYLLVGVSAALFVEGVYLLFLRAPPIARTSIAA